MGRGTGAESRCQRPWLSGPLGWQRAGWACPEQSGHGPRSHGPGGAGSAWAWCLVGLGVEMMEGGSAALANLQQPSVG